MVKHAFQQLRSLPNFASATLVAALPVGATAGAWALGADRRHGAR